MQFYFLYIKLIVYKLYIKPAPIRQSINTERVHFEMSSKYDFHCHCLTESLYLHRFNAIKHVKCLYNE